MYSSIILCLFYYSMICPKERSYGSRFIFDTISYFIYRELVLTSIVLTPAPLIEVIDSFVTGSIQVLSTCTSLS
jgi:hypothetical protein